MKKISLLMFSVLACGLLFLSSCSSDSSTPQAQLPSIQFVGGTGYTSGDVTVATGASLKIGIIALSNSTSNAKLVNFTITSVSNNVPHVLLDSTINTNSYTVDIKYTASVTAGQENLIFKVTDKDGQANQVSLVVTTTATAGPINSWSQKILGAQSNTTGSSFASSNGTVYTLDQAKINSNLIDWVYFYGATNLACLASPADPDAQSVFNSDVNGISTWAVKNNTVFKKVTDNIVWSNVTDDSIILAETATGVDQTKIPQLAVGDILAFITVAGKSGLIRVEAIETGSSGTMTISVKVQQ